MPSMFYNNMRIVCEEEDFYNFDKKLRHIKEKYNGYSQESVQTVFNIFKNIGESEKEKDRDVAFFNQSELKELFESNRWLMIGTMESKKTIIREYMRWYKENDEENCINVDIRSTIDQIKVDDLNSESLYKLEWFKSFDELQEEINVVVDLYEGVDVHELDIAITTIYLAWCGASSKDAVQMKKENIAQTVNQIYLPVTQQYLKVEPQIMVFLKKVRDFDGYSILTKHGVKFCGYRDSAFLLRSIRASHLSEITMWSNLTRFSERYSESGKTKKFKYDRIKKSSQYLKVIEYEKLHGDLTLKDLNAFADLIENISITDDKVRMGFYNKFRNYQLYKEYYYSDQDN